MEERKLQALAEGPVLQSIFKMALPMVMGMMVQILYNLIDVYFIGQLGDANQLATANMALPVFTILMAMGSVIGTGGASYVSRCLGEQSQEKANRTLAIALMLLSGMSVVMMLVGFVGLGPIVRGMGASDATLGYMKVYVGIMFAGSIPVMFNFAIGQLLRAAGEPIKSMIGMLIGTVVNIVLDPLFIFVFKMGVGGAALATVLGNAVALGYYIWCFNGKRVAIHIHKEDMKWDKQTCWEILKIGVPASLNQLLMSFAAIIANNIAIGYGEDTVAGMGVALKIVMIGTFIFIGFSAGCQPLVGYNYGAKQFGKIKEILFKTGVMMTGIGIVLAIVFSMLAGLLVGVFSPENPNVVEIGSGMLKVFVLSLPFMGFQMLITNSVQAMGKATMGLILSVSRQGILYVPLLVLFNRLWGYKGFVYAQPVTDMLMTVLAGIIICYVIRRETRQHQ